MTAPVTESGAAPACTAKICRTATGALLSRTSDPLTVSLRVKIPGLARGRGLAYGALA